MIEPEIPYILQCVDTHLQGTIAALERRVTALEAQQVVEQLGQRCPQCGGIMYRTFTNGRMELVCATCASSYLSAAGAVKKER